MKYAKLINGVIEYAPKKIKHDDSITYNPPVEMITELGYKPLIETPMPEAPEGFHYVLSYRDDGTNIIYVWTMFEDEPDADEIVNILVGETE